MYALERPKTPYAAEDRVRGTVGLFALVLGFALQAAGYAAVLGRSHRLLYGMAASTTGIAIALVAAAMILIIERSVRPRWRDKILVQVARFDPKDGSLFDYPMAHVLKSFGEQLGHEPWMGETDADYCLRVFKVQARRPDRD